MMSRFKNSARTAVKNHLWLLGLSYIWLFSPFCYAASLPPITGQKAMVVTAQHYATAVGVKVLKQGGNAIDAAVAIGYALAVVEPCCGNIGGGGFMLIHLANGKNTFINFREKAPVAISPQLFLNQQGQVKSQNLSTGYAAGKAHSNYLAVGVPGTVLGLNTALAKYGTLPLATVMQPAITLAKNGYILTPGDITVFNYGAESFPSQPNVAKIFLKNGQLYQAGDRLVQTNLAKTLTAIAQQGSQAFYRGKIADEIVQASKENGGVITKDDLRHYTVEEMQPLTCHYRGYDVITSPPPASGATICEMLNILSGYSFTPNDYHSAASTHDAIEAMRYAYADRNQYLGDPDWVKNPIQKLLSPEYAATIRQKIKANKAGNSQQLGFTSTNKEGHETTSYAVVDRFGNAVSVIYTLNDYFGARIIPKNTGFFLNNELDDFTIKPNVANNFGLIQGNANLIAPNKRPLSSISPTLLLHRQQFYMAVGTPGGSTIPTQILEAIQNNLDYGMDIQASVDAPRFHFQWLPDVVYQEPYTFSADTLAKLTAMGYQFKTGAPWGTPLWGGMTAIVRNPMTGQLQGAIDARRPAGSAQGY